MQRRVFIIALLCCALLGGAWAVRRLTSLQTAPARPPAAPATPARPPQRAEARRPAAAPPTAVRPPARRAVVPTPATPTAPVPAAPPEAAPAVGTLRVDSDVPGAQVFIDREYMGVTPITVPNVALGHHHLNISAPGYEGLSEDVDVEPGPRELRFNFKEIRLDARIDVVHKHRFGACQGRLIATPQELRYDTTNKDDALSIRLADLEGFEVDYLAKVLRVKVKKGRRYDFTDPEANADRLFVFHRDVEKVRQRLNVSPTSP